MADQVREETPAEEALRSLACWLGVGGYNAPTVDAKVFEAKIREGVTTYLPLHGMAARDLAELVLDMGMVTDKGIRARELARRVLGIVPPAATASHAAEVEAMRADAERYRWLRAQKALLLESATGFWTRPDGSRFHPTHRLCAGDTQFAATETLDEAIDAALKGDKP